ncbi:hypothetical protein KAK06_00880 [Ideonella sp. 4Y11]|uniref:Uncharacterized protein n=1 Tax=Ideonella aquatica TaxID=2824119 RepID=A0A940YGP2_9BURK|nr:hypothetical protein [Ideonella aquatica]MBQ0957499.1 hypothetical protein [Ideonella aquatica]
MPIQIGQVDATVETRGDAPAAAADGGPASELPDDALRQHLEALMQRSAELEDRLRAWGRDD